LADAVKNNGAAQGTAETPAGKPKKEKKAKTPKPKREKKAKAPRQKRERGQKREKPEKGESRGKPKLVLAIVIIGLIAAAGAMYYFNILGLKTRVVGFFISQDTQYQDAIAAKADYETMKSELDERQLQLSEKEKQLAEDEASLQEREKKLREQETASSSTGTSQLSGETGEAQIVQVFEGMSNSAAAEILNRTTDNGWIANLLLQLDEKKAGKILAAMDVDKAVVITRLMSE